MQKANRNCQKTLLIDQFWEKEKGEKKRRAERAKRRNQVKQIFKSRRRNEAEEQLRIKDDAGKGETNCQKTLIRTCWTLLINPFWEKKAYFKRRDEAEEQLRGIEDAEGEGEMEILSQDHTNNEIRRKTKQMADEAKRERVRRLQCEETERKLESSSQEHTKKLAEMK